MYEFLITDNAFYYQSIGYVKIWNDANGKITNILREENRVEVCFVSYNFAY